jgi:hypothetical protein
MQKTETERKAAREKERRVFRKFFCVRAHINTKKEQLRFKKKIFFQRAKEQLLSKKSFLKSCIEHGF